MTQEYERAQAAGQGGLEREDSPAAMGPLLGLSRTALRHRRLMVLVPGFAAVLTLLGTLLQPRSYTGESSFVPQGQDASLSRLAGLAAQFGVAVPGQTSALSADFYADLLTTAAILGPIVEEPFRGAAQADTAPRTLVHLLRARGRDSAAKHEDAVKRLRKALLVTADVKTSVVTLKVRTRWPALSQQLASRLVAGVLNFDVHTRQTRGSAERQFVETRLNQAKSELRDAEDHFERFLERNRQYQESPPLQFQFDRLQREVTSRQQVYTSLQQSFEQARIDEVRNVPGSR